MSAGTYNFEVEQYADFKRVLTFKSAGVPINLTGAVIQGHLRLTKDSDVLYPLTFTFIDRPNGKVRMSLSVAITTELPSKGLNGVYDVIMTDSLGERIRVFAGTWTVSKGVTR